MGSPVDLTLACSTQAVRDGGCGGSMYPGDYLESLRKAEEYLQSLEDERRKVEGFKRELPLCIQLLEDAIQASKEKVASGKRELQETRGSIDCEKEYHYGTNRPAGCTRLEEFMPLNMNSLPLKRRWDRGQNEDGGSDDGETDGTEEEEQQQQQQQQRGSKRPAWMAEAQLWTQTSTVSSDRTKEKEAEQMDQEQSSVTSSQQQQQQQQNLLSAKERPAGAFLPFFREQPGTTSPVRPVARTSSGAGLSLSFGSEPVLASSSPPSLQQKPADSEAGSFEATLQQQSTPENVGNQQVVSKEAAMAAGAGSSSGGGQSLRKARRCWSPELHRRFVNALYQLGGCQIATPKQIRELMKVDGLTNDEVKSHLQKYRLHTRRPSPSPQSTTTAGGAQQQQPPPQLVVLGGIWVSPKYHSSAGSGAAQGGPTYEPQQFQCHSAPPQDGGAYFTCIGNATTNVQMHHHHRQPVFEPASQAQCSPQGPLQVTSQLSGATVRSSEVYHDESGEDDEEEEAKSDSTSWKMQRRSSAERDSCSNMKLAAKEPAADQPQESLK